MKKLMKPLFVLMSLVLCTQLGAQCDTLRHNTTWFDGWISCEATENPNSVRGSGHWIQYDFGETYKLYELHIWNTNAPDLLDYGMQNVVIDVSLDGTTWTEAGQYLIPQADGDSHYEGAELMSFDSAIARFVIITAIDNYGGNCFGLSEMRVRASEACPEQKIEWIAGNGDWDVPSNWCAGRVPDKEDEVIIPSGVVVTVPIGFVGEAKKVDVDPTAELRVVGKLEVLKEN